MLPLAERLVCLATLDKIPTQSPRGSTTHRYRTVQSIQLARHRIPGICYDTFAGWSSLEFAADDARTLLDRIS